jgi:hypothetical protein
MFRTDALTALALERTGGEPLFVAMMQALLGGETYARSPWPTNER